MLWRVLLCGSVFYKLLHGGGYSRPVLFLVYPDAVDDVVVGIAGRAGTAPDDEALVQVDVPAGQEALAEVVEALAVEDEEAVGGVSVALEEEEGALEARLGPCAVEVAVDDCIGGGVEDGCDVWVVPAENIEVDGTRVHFVGGG